MTHGSRRRRRFSPAAAGISSAVLGVGIGELAAAVLAPAASPLSVVGATLIDLAPPWAKDVMIQTFGTTDKAVLIVLVCVVLLVLAAFIGLWAQRKVGLASVLVLTIGVGVGALATTRDDASALSWLPAVLAGIVTAIALRLLVRRAQVVLLAPGDATTRRGFLTVAGISTAVGVLAAVSGSAFRAAKETTARIRAVVLPSPAQAVPALPTDADLDIDGLASLITPNDDFYRIDTALIVPSVNPDTWELRIHGLVENEVRLTWSELTKLPLQEAFVTLSCVSNPVGGELVGNARWLGYPIRELLAKARPAADADMVLSTSADGFTASTPIEALTDDRNALLAIAMNGEPLAAEHGSPVRMVVPGLYGYVSATKWVVDLEVTRFADAKAYWSTRGWSERGPIKLSSRIDVPRGGQAEAGDTVIAGMAWLPHTGVSAVEVQIDDGPWQQAELGYEISDDTWVQWRLPWKAQAGQHRIRCRATDRSGSTQTPDIAYVTPDGATGWHTIDVTVS